MKKLLMALLGLAFPAMALATTPTIKGPRNEGASVVVEISATAVPASHTDTTAVIFLRDVRWSEGSTANEYSCFLSTSQTAGDSITVSLDWGMDGTTWGSPVLLANAVMSGSTITYGGSGQDKYPRFLRARILNSDSTAHDYTLTLVFPRAR